jgi:hypothetical protein
MPDDGELAAAEEALKEELSRLLRGLKEARESSLRRTITFKEIADWVHQRQLRTRVPGDPGRPVSGKPKTVSTLSEIFSGKELTTPEYAYDLVLELRGDVRQAKDAARKIDEFHGLRRAVHAQQRKMPGPLASETPLAGVVDAVLACLPGRESRGGAPTAKRKLRLATGIVLGRAVWRYADNGKASLAAPLLHPAGFLAAPGPAAILAGVIAGNEVQAGPSANGAHELGQAWAEAYLAGTRARDLTRDAAEFLGFVRDEQQARRTRSTLPELQRAAAQVRDQLTDLARPVTAGTGDAVADLPTLIRAHLYDQTHLLAAATRDFTGRQFVFEKLEDFTKQGKSGYCFVMAHPGVGKTALLASFALAHPGYARHFNVFTENLTSHDAFLKNVCAQLIGAYGLPYDNLPERAAHDSGFLVEVLDRSVRAARGEPVVILVDALDEALTEGRPLGANPLYLPKSLPDGVRVIVTVRTGSRDWQPRVDPDCLSETWTINERGPENMADIRAYIAVRARHPGTGAYLRSRALSADDFAGDLAEKSQGNFMYLRYVLPQFEEGGAHGDAELARLPVGLVGYYEEQFKRMHGPDEDAWHELRLPVLTALALAREPLTAPDVAARAGVRGGTRVQSLINEWMQFLMEVPVTRNGRPRTGYRAFHASFHDFLREKIRQFAEDEEDEDELDDEIRRRFLGEDDWGDAAPGEDRDG